MPLINPFSFSVNVVLKNFSNLPKFIFSIEFFSVLLSVCIFLVSATPGVSISLNVKPGYKGL